MHSIRDIPGFDAETYYMQKSVDIGLLLQYNYLANGAPDSGSRAQLNRIGKAVERPLTQSYKGLNRKDGSQLHQNYAGSHQK